jgi:hypothetical protein
MKFLTILSTVLLGLACVLLALGIWEAVGSPRMQTNPYLSRDGIWIEDPTGFSDDDFHSVGLRIGSEINSLRSVIEHNYNSNGLMVSSTLSAIFGGLLAVLRIKTMRYHAPQCATEPAPLTKS